MKLKKDLPHRRYKRHRPVDPIADLVPATAVLLEAPDAAAAFGHRRPGSYTSDGHHRPA
jgi:hypothetical protein